MARVDSNRPSLASVASRGRRQAALHEVLRAAIVDGRLRPAARLPSTRELAREHGVARGTVVAVFEQLAAEGYLASRRGSGTFVKDVLPDELLSRGPVTAQVAPRRQPPRLAARAAELIAEPQLATGARSIGHPFVAHLPALDAFPIDLWTRVVGACARRATRADLAGCSPLGHPRLRDALAAYLGAFRGVRCRPEQVVVLSGLQPAVDLTARLLLDAGDAAWVEDPGYFSVANALRAAGVRIVPVPVDGEGLDVDAGRRSAPDARLAYVTPAHQAPRGVALSLARRRALLSWARRAGAWILEDDYDSEFRYQGKPLPSIHSLDEDGRVLHAASFSKTLFPGLRLGYLVVPEGLVDAFARARSLLDRFPAILPQLVVAQFIEGGHYARHLRRMRELYAERRAALVGAVERRLGDRLVLEGDAAGLDVLCWLRGRNVDAERVAAAAAARSVYVQPVSLYGIGRSLDPGLLLGFASAPARRLVEGIDRLAEAMGEAAARR